MPYKSILDKRKAWKKYQLEHPEYVLFMSAKHRAKAKELNFDIDISDIIIPKFCPVLGIPLKQSDGKRGPSYNSPTLDRRDNSRGYTKDNIAVISYKANSCKSDLTKDQLRSLWEYA